MTSADYWDEPTAYIAPLRRTWGEGTGTGDGSAAEAGDATWNAAQYGSVTWTTVGAQSDSTDRYAAYSSTAINTAVNRWVTWDATTMVANWANGTVTNNGAIIYTTTTYNSTKTFSSKENTTVANRPKLTVTYTPAVNSSFAFPQVIICE